MKSFLIAYLVAFFIVGLPATTYSQPKPAETVKEGDQAQNLKVLPPWTMRKCPQTFYATYDQDGAKLLKMRDNDCHLWDKQREEMGKQVTAQGAVIKTLREVNEEHTAQHKRDEQRIESLTKQVKEEIAEKNKYKYQPNYNWLYISIGAALAIAGICFGAGVWVTKKD